MEWHPVICATCGDRIGVYEPVALIDEGETRFTSLAREPLLPLSSAILIHRACAAAAREEFAA